MRGACPVCPALWSCPVLAPCWPCVLACWSSGPWPLSLACPAFPGLPGGGSDDTSVEPSFIWVPFPTCSFLPASRHSRLSSFLQQPPLTGPSPDQGPSDAPNVFVQPSEAKVAKTANPFFARRWWHLRLPMVFAWHPGILACCHHTHPGRLLH